MNQHRFSYLSCETDDSETLPTPLDASPCLPLATHIITVVPNESLPDRPHIPTIATNRRQHPPQSSSSSTVYEQQRRQQQLRHWEQSDTVATLQQQPQQRRRRSWSLSSSLPSSPSNLWPRLKQMVFRLHSNNSSSNTDSDTTPAKKQQHVKDDGDHIEQQDDLSSQLSALKISPKAEDNKRRLWLFEKKQKKTRIQPS